IRAHAAWNVITHIARTRRPTSSPARSRISPAALLVNVIARISFGFAASVATRYAIRWVSTRVLPDPAPARIKSGPPGYVTASRWGSLSPSSRASRSVVVSGIGSCFYGSGRGGRDRGRYSPPMSFVLRVHDAVYKASGGRIGHRVLGVPTLMLTTTGRRSAQPRTTS